MQVQAWHVCVCFFWGGWVGGLLCSRTRTASTDLVAPRHAQEVDGSHLPPVYSSAAARIALTRWLAGGAHTAGAGAGVGAGGADNSLTTTTTLPPTVGCAPLRTNRTGTPISKQSTPTVPPPEDEDISPTPFPRKKQP
jgi:hypothetical protein